MKTLFVDYDEFCNWYFTGDRTENENIIGELIEKGEISLKNYAKQVGYIPVRLVENKDQINSDHIDSYQDPDFDELMDPRENGYDIVLRRRNED